MAACKHVFRVGLGGSNTSGRGGNTGEASSSIQQGGPPQQARGSRQPALSTSPDVVAGQGSSQTSAGQARVRVVNSSQPQGGPSRNIQPNSASRLQTDGLNPTNHVSPRGHGASSPAQATQRSSGGGEGGRGAPIPPHVGQRTPAGGGGGGGGERGAVQRTRTGPDNVAAGTPRNTTHAQSGVTNSKNSNRTVPGPSRSLNSNAANIQNQARPRGSSTTQPRPTTGRVASPLAVPGPSGMNGVSLAHLPPTMRTNMVVSASRPPVNGNQKSKAKYRTNVQVAGPSRSDSSAGGNSDVTVSRGNVVAAVANAKMRVRAASIAASNTQDPALVTEQPVPQSSTLLQQRPGTSNTQNNPPPSSSTSTSTPNVAQSNVMIPISSNPTPSTSSRITSSAPVLAHVSDPPAEPAQQYQSRIQIQQARAGASASLPLSSIRIAPNPGSRPVSAMSDIVVNINEDPPPGENRPNLNLDVIGSQNNTNHAQGQGRLGSNPGLGRNGPAPSEALPDILNSHLLPPYTPRQNQHRGSRPGGQGRSRGNRNQGRRRQSNPTTQIDDNDKGCCSLTCCLGCITMVTTFRWVLVSLAMLGVCCVVTGIILGALHMTVGSSFLTLSLMFIGLGVMLVVVVGVGWRCTPPGHEPCHLLFNLGEHTHHTGSTRTRSAQSGHRERHWYGGSLYPEFRFRRPPPSYNASMQEYQQQLALAQLQGAEGGAGGVAGGEDNPDNYSLPSSPPPTYRSQASTIRPGLHITFPPTRDGDYPSSRPPTYRSHTSQADTRPSLLHDNCQHGGNESGTRGGMMREGLDNPGCEDAMSGRQGAAPIGGDVLPSTLPRAQLVVDYLEGVNDNQNQAAAEGAAGSSQNSTNRAESVADTQL